MPPFVMKTLVPFRTHSSPSQHGRRAQRAHVGAGARLGDRVGAELDLVARAEALGNPARRSARACRSRRSRPRRASRPRSRARCPRSPSAAPRRRCSSMMPSGSAPTFLIWSMPWRPHSRAALMTSHGTLSSRSYCGGDRPDDLRREPPAGPLELELFVVEPEIHGIGASAALTDQSIVPRQTAFARSPARPGASDAFRCTAGYRPLGIAPFAALLLLSPSPSPAADLGEDESSPAPQVGVEADDEQAAEKLGFPSTATRNTVRVGGGDAAADAAGVAGALYPGHRRRRPADRRRARRPGGLAARHRRLRARRAADRRADPALGRRRAAGGDRGHARAARPQGLGPLRGRPGDPHRARRGPRPEGFKTAVVEGDDPFERAAAIDRFFSAARGEPSDDIVLYSGEQAEWAMPAAAWAARSGDAVLPVRKATRSRRRCSTRSASTSARTCSCSARDRA